MRIQGPDQGRVVSDCGGGAAGDDEIEITQKGAVPTKALAGQALQAVAVDGAPRLLARDGEPEPWAGAVPSGPREHAEIGIGGLGRACEDAAVVAGVEQAGAPRKGLPGTGFVGRWRWVSQNAGEPQSGREPSAAFGPAGLEHGTPVAGCAAGAKPMVAGTLESAWIEGLLHDVSPERMSGMGDARGTAAPFQRGPGRGYLRRLAQPAKKTAKSMAEAGLGQLRTAR